VERGRNSPRSIRFPIWDTLTLSGDIRDRNLKLSEIAQNFACFGPNFLGGRTPELLDLHYKVDPDCDHVVKFHCDRPRELGGSPAKVKKNITGKQNVRPSGTNVPGGLTMLFQAKQYCSKFASLNSHNGFGIGSSG